MKPGIELTPAIEDYLRAIYKLSRRNAEGENVTTTQLADTLGLKPASVTVMLQRLAATNPPLVDYHKHQGARLTAAGEQAALGVVRHHRLLEQYLHEKLGFGWDEVHDEADRMEHAIGDLLAARMSAALGNPTHDPHGHAIPGEDLALARAAFIPLGSLSAGQCAVVRNVRDDDPAVLRLLDQLGLRPGTPVCLLAADEAGGSLTLHIGAPPTTAVIDAATAAYVSIHEINNAV